MNWMLTYAVEHIKPFYVLRPIKEPPREQTGRLSVDSRWTFCRSSLRLGLNFYIVAYFGLFVKALTVFFIRS